MRPTTTFAFLLLASACALGACGKGESPAPSSGGAASSGVAADVADAKKAAGTANGRCPVLIDQLVESDAPTIDYDDPVTKKKVKIGFCCEKCPPKFQAEPEKFMARMRAEPAKYGYAP